jgi:hypothetical protein
LQDGKNPLSMPFAGPGSPSVRLLPGKPVLLAGNIQNLNSRPVPPNVKSSPISESDSPSQGKKLLFF